ncbi:MAG: DUF6057 family protein [Bacteroidaceae bacterium]|nr:DUF6057 family protein [Bacteroidaceae bacterium]
MKYTSANTRRTARTIPFVCGFLFAAFSFVYLYFLQADLLAFLQFCLSNGQTHYDALVGASLITLVLTLFGLCLQRLMSLPVRALALAWLPSCFLLLLLTGWDTQSGTNDAICLPSLAQLVILAVLAVVYLFALFLSRVYHDVASERALFNIHLAPNLLVLALAFLVVGIMGNTSTPLHYELQMERLLDTERFSDALRVGEQAQATSPRLSTMRCYALSHEGLLGEQLFAYSLNSGSAQILPSADAPLREYAIADSICQYVGLQPSMAHSSILPYIEHACARDTVGSPVLRDYLLTACLLDRDLSRAADLLCTDSLTSFPTHYREALLLLAAQDTTFRVPFADAPMQQALSEFLTEMAQKEKPTQPEDRLRRHFAHTYWYYYFFSR